MFWLKGTNSSGPEHQGKRLQCVRGVCAKTNQGLKLWKFITLLDTLSICSPKILRGRILRGEE
jgi:hypothetical protein